MNAIIPESFRDLLDRPVCAAFTTVMPDGQPQTTVVWTDYDGAFVMVNTMRGFRKEKNMRQNPKVTLLAYEPSNTRRYLEVRGCVAEMTEDGAEAHLDGLSEKYTGRRPYFGNCVPAELKRQETPVLCKIRPVRVVTRDFGPPRPGPEALEPLPPPPVPSVIPASHLDLLLEARHGILTTMMPDGQPQSSLVWCDTDGAFARVNTTLERQKGRNMQANPKVTLLVIDPRNSGRWIEIRGEVTFRYDGALEHLDRLTRQYTRHAHYYGGVLPAEQQAHDTRVICNIRPVKITLDAIH